MWPKCGPRRGRATTAGLHQFGLSLAVVAEVYDYFFDNVQQLHIDRLERKLADVLELPVSIELAHRLT